MKMFFIISALFLSFGAFATEINTGIENMKFKQWESILEGQADWAREVFDQYSEEKLGCSKVKFKLKINKSPGIFSAGNYDLKITASCTEEFSDFKFKFFDGYNEDYTTLDISYVKNGKLVKKAFKTDAWY